MKGTFLVAIVIIFSMLAIPLTTFDKNEVVISVAKPQSDIVYEKTKNEEENEKIKVLKDGEVLEYGLSDYIFGVVAAEMPALYEKEALKAQAVAAYTFACYIKEGSKNDEYDISADPETAQCFITREEATTRWGEKAQEYITKIEECILSVKGEILTYDDKPIFAAYHAISSGVTNDSVDVWGSELPYLKSVDSLGDVSANGYLSEVKLSAEEVAEKLKDFATPQEDANEYFTNVKTNDNGYVKSVDYCGKEISGSDLRECLELRSSNFEINFSDGVFAFTVKGYGHGVGMSQTGADYMAKQGSSYEEILAHYYPNTTLQKK